MFSAINRGFLLSIALLSISACQAPANVQQMQAQNQQLQEQLASANQQISSLQSQQQQLQADHQELNRVAAVLGTEKNSRVAESSELRAQVRKFVQTHIDALKAFLVEGNLLDYVGSALIERAEQNTPATLEKTQPLLLVDYANPIPKSGTLTGVGAIATTPTDLTVKVMRRVEDQWVVIWSSRRLELSNPGFNRTSFMVNVGVEKGDVVAYYFPLAATVSFDSGTGATLYRSEDINIGGILKRSSLKGAKQRRAYSIGVYGLLNDSL